MNVIDIQDVKPHVEITSGRISGYIEITYCCCS